MLIVGVPLQQVRFDHLRAHVQAKLHRLTVMFNFLNFSGEFSGFDRRFQDVHLREQITAAINSPTPDCPP